MGQALILLLIAALYFGRTHASWTGGDVVWEMVAHESQQHMDSHEMYHEMKSAVIEKLKTDAAIVHGDEVVDKMLRFLDNQKDHLVDTCVPNTKTIELTFNDETRTFVLCSVPYTLGPLHLTVTDGDSIVCADQRVTPTIEIKEHGLPVTDGLYALIIVDRDLIGYELWGTLDQPYVHLMVLNIHGSDVANGYVVQEWESATWSAQIQVFLYRQTDVIYSDFNLGKYVINGNGCMAFNRCYFFQNQFVKDYGLVLDSISTFAVNTDPWYPRFEQDQGIKSAQEACVEHMSYTADKVMEYHGVDTTDIGEVLSIWKMYTLKYMSESTYEKYDSAIEHQRAYLRGYYSDAEEDTLVPYQSVFTHKVAFWFNSPPESIGPMCEVRFHLLGVNKKCYLDGESISAAEQRHVPKIRIMDADTHRQDTASYFTLILADRIEGVYSLDVQTRDEPYLLWLVMNIRDSDLPRANHKTPYLPGYDSTDSIVLLYKQNGGYIDDFPIYSYTNSACESQARCRFEVARFRESYNMELVSASNYTITGDVYSAMEQMRRGFRSPGGACEDYLNTILE